jgi:hypothetical protein
MHKRDLLVSNIYWKLITSSASDITEVILAEEQTGVLE